MKHLKDFLIDNRLRRVKKLHLHSRYDNENYRPCFERNKTAIT